PPSVMKPTQVQKIRLP
ncbi:putative calcium-binding outer membrane-like protein, partial [Vibrio parahaemolyticus V-223/04]